MYSSRTSSRPFWVGRCYSSCGCEFKLWIPFHYIQWVVVDSRCSTPYLLTCGRDFAEVRMMWETIGLTEVHWSGKWIAVVHGKSLDWVQNICIKMSYLGVRCGSWYSYGHGVHAHGIECFGVLCENTLPLIDAEIEMADEAQRCSTRRWSISWCRCCWRLGGSGWDSGENIEGLKLSHRSSVHDLRRICEYFGTSQFGSERKMHERIVTCHVVALRRQALDMYLSW